MFRKIKKINVFVLCAVCACLIATPFGIVNADSYAQTKTTPEEEAVFAFFRAIGSAPDYEFWITTMDEFRSVPENLQEKFILQETLRLGRGYSMHNQDKDLLELTVRVLAKYIPGSDGQAPRMTFNFFNADEAYIPSFNYSYGEDVIALVINRLAAFSDMPLSEAQNEALSKKLPYENEDFDAVLTIHVRASEQSSSHPKKGEAGSGKQWLMVGEVAYLKCDVDSFVAKEENLVLWDYVAPWYVEEFEAKNAPEEEKYPHPFDLFKD